MRNIIVIVCAVLGIAGGVGYFLARGKIDTKDADDKIKTVIEGAVAPVSKVDCPSAARKKGSKFTCKVEFKSGQKYDLNVEITDDNGGWKPNWSTPIVGAEKTAADITTTFNSKIKDLKVDCGKDVVEVPAAGYLCTATSGGQTGHVRVKFDATTGNFVYALEP